VKLRVQQSGGFAHFPGLSQPLEVDTDALPSEDARTVRDCLEGAGFFELLETQPHRLPDARVYTISAEDGSRFKSLQFSDPLPDPHLETLLALVQRLARGNEQAKTPS
jgi:hypothetical protein